MRVIVIGSGLAGATTAFYLARAGADVTVLERAAGPGLGTSYANGALLHASLVEPWNSPGILWQLCRNAFNPESIMRVRLRALPSLIGWGLQFLRHSSPRRFEANTLRNLRLALYSLEQMRRLRADWPIQYAQRMNGVLGVLRSERARSAARQLIAILHQHDVESKPLSRDDVVALEPALAATASDLVGGVYFPGDESGDAHRFCVEITQAAIRHGAQFRFDVAACGFTASAARVDAVRLQRSDGGAEILAADAFVLAAGVESVALGKSLALELPVRPAKGYSITLPRRGDDGSPRLPVADLVLHYAIVPLDELRLRVVSHAEFAGSDLSIAPERIAQLRALLARSFPRFAARVDDGDVAAWAGLRPMCCDGVPLLGRAGYDNFYLNTGHGHLGWTLAAGSARLVSDAVLGRSPELSMGDYRYDRS